MAPKLVVPRSQAEMEELLNDGSKLKTWFQDKESREELFREYGRLMYASDPELLRQQEEQTQRILAQMLRDNDHGERKLNLSPSTGLPNLAAQKHGIYNQAAPGAQLDKHFGNKAEYFRSIWHQADTLRDSDKLRGLKSEAMKITNSYGSTVPSDGGFLIPERLRSEILQVALETAIVRPRAMVVPMDSLTVPFPAIDETTHSGSVFGGVIAYWTEEGAAATESQAKFGVVKLEGKKLVIYSEAPNELVADAPAFGAFLDNVLPQAAAWYEDRAFLKGSGVGEPLGVYNAPAMITVNRGTVDTIVWTDVVNVFSRALPVSMGRGVWLAAPDALPQLANMSIVIQQAGSNVGGAPIWFGPGEGKGPIPASLLGRPLIITEKAPQLTAVGGLAFIDFGFYLLGDRQAMTATSSPHFKFSSDKTAYKIVERVDGRPWLNSALTPENGSSNTLSPFVQLAT